MKEVNSVNEESAATKEVHVFGFGDAAAVTYLIDVGVLLVHPLGLAVALDQVEGGGGLLEDVLPQVLVLPLAEAELGLQGTDLCLELPDLVGGGVHGGRLDFGGADLVGLGHGDVGERPGVEVEPLVSTFSLCGGSCVHFVGVICNVAGLITSGISDLLDSGALLLDHVVREDVVAVAPDRLLLQPQALLHQRLPLGRAQLLPLLLLAQAVPDALPVGLALAEEAELGAGVLGRGGLLLGHVYGGVFKVCLKLIVQFLR